MPIKELRRRLDSKQLSAAELTNYYLKRIKKYDKALNSFITVCEDSALAAANEAQKLIDSNRQSFLTGIPIAVKDNICTKGIRTTCASGMLSGFVPAYNATAVQRLTDCSAVILGKTNLDEFAMGSSNETSRFGSVKNPYDTQRIPGGSSGGSAAAVSAGLCAAALGSDTGGSVRQPASLCGVTGFKPTYGAISRYGLTAFASSLDTIGFLTDSAEDAAYMMNCTAGEAAEDSTSCERFCTDFTEFFAKARKGMKIGIPKECFSGGLSPEIEKCVLNAVDFFRFCGCAVSEVSLTGYDLFSDIYTIISCAEASSNLARFDGIKYGAAGECNESFDMLIRSSRSGGFSDEVKRRIMLGTYFLSADNYNALYIKARSLRENVSKEFNAVFDSCDLIITPSTAGAAYKFGDSAAPSAICPESDRQMVAANLAGLPSVSTPCGYTKDNMPVGLCITGAAYSDSSVLAAADLFEKEYFSVKRKPNIFSELL